jgi:glycosyltransferase involved in cell wall biosynthesis
MFRSDGMKILQVAPYFYPYIGGQERYVKSLAKMLVRRGNEVEVLTSKFLGGKRCEVIEGARVRRFNFFCRPLNNPISLSPLFYLTRHCRDFDIIHCHNEHALLSQYCAFVRSYLEVPLIVTCHGQLRFDHFAKDFAEHAYNKTLGRKLLTRADRVVTISGSDREYVCSLGVPEEKAEVIPNGVDLTEFTLQNNFGQGHGTIFEGKHIVLFVGPLIRRKGPHVLIKAIPAIVKKWPNVIFVLVGEGSSKEEALKLVRELKVEKNTCFTGRVSERRMYDLYRRCDMFVLPSFSEALPYTILDAFVFSKPAISTLIPCVRDHLKGSALLIPPGNSEALANAVIRLLEDKKLAKELGMKGRHLVETKFRWDLVVDMYLKVYNEALNDLQS